MCLKNSHNWCVQRKHCLWICYKKTEFKRLFVCFFLQKNIWQRFSVYQSRWDVLLISSHISHTASVAQEPNEIQVAQAPRVINTRRKMTGGHGCDPCGVGTEASNVNHKWKENCLRLWHDHHDKATGGSAENKNGKLYCIATATSDLMAVYFSLSPLRLHNYFLSAESG